MALEQKDVLEYLGIKEAPADLPAFQKAFEDSFIKKNPDVIKQDEEFYGKIIGTKTGAIITRFRKGLKESGVEFPEKEIEGKKTEEVMELGIKKMRDFYSSQIEALKEQAGQGNEEKFQELQKKYEKVESKLADTKSLHDSLQETYNKEKESWQSQMKGIKLQTRLGEAFKGIKWKTGITDIEKKGFHANLQELYKIELDEKDNIEIFGKDGHRLKSAKVAGEFKTLDEVLEEQGRKDGVWESNPIAGKGRVIPQHAQPILQSNGQQVAAQAATNIGRQRVLRVEGRANEGK